MHLPPIKNGVLIADDHGKILDLLDPLTDEMPDSLQVKKYDGFLCPGFVNAHCHLELSHLKNKISQKKGLPFFIGEMVEKREAGNDAIIEAMAAADSEIYSNGIVAVGDISNSSISADIKSKSKIFYYSFIELFDIFPGRAESVFANGVELQSEFNAAGLKSSIVPHAPYTVTEQLMKLICDKAVETGKILCIHNQESSSENKMFIDGSGNLIDKLQQMTGAYSNWMQSGKSSLKTIIATFANLKAVQLVHNTFSNAEDIRTANQIQKKLFWCLCVNANLFIENKLPDVAMMKEENCKITIGTDSYASNTSLSILEELKTISQNFPGIELRELICWSSKNGADFLSIDKKFGSFEKGKQPGINLITNIDTKEIRLRKDSRVERLI